MRGLFMAECYRLLEDGGLRLLEDGGIRLLEVCEISAPNGNRPREYQPTYHELRERRRIEEKFEEAELALKSTEIKIEQLEFRRLRDLADSAMQFELLGLIAQQQELSRLLHELQQQKLRALQDDDDFMMLLMSLPN